MAREEESMGQLSGKTAVVTGSAWGIGRAIALALAEQGANVIVNYRQSEAAAEEVAAAARARGVRATAVRADVATSEGAHHLVAQGARALAPPDILVNNVGDFLLKTVAETTSAEWRQIFSSNVDSAFYVSRCALPHMRAEGWGRIVNLTFSPVEHMGARPRAAAYTAAKAAVLSFTRSLAAEEVKHGITVNAVGPGFVDTGPDRLSEELRKLMLHRSPLGRLARPEEVARAVVFLCHPDASYVTGTQLSLSGGWGL
jgi:3-oxoacyl-[acyl-carrier protein] reductase